MIEINGLDKRYGIGNKSIHALQGIDLRIDPGMFGLLGPNGAGKTTLMRILAGIATPTSGNVSVFGYNLGTEKGRQALKRQLGYLPQELGLYPDLSARQFVDYMAVLKGMQDATDRKKRVDQALELVSLTQVADRKIKGFSGGMKRRVGIAQAIVNNPRILIVDEPTAGLDPEERIRFRNLLVSLAVERIVILSTHIVEDIGQTCRDMAILARGRIVFRGSPLDLTLAAEGHVWSLMSADGILPAGAALLSMLHLAEGVQYRLVGEDLSAIAGAELTQPGLEDGYVWLMQKTGQNVARTEREPLVLP